MNEIDFIGNKKYPANDIGVSQLFIDMFKDEIVYCKKMGWYVWNGQYWQLDDRDGGTVNEKIKDMARYCIFKLYETPMDNDERTRQLRFWNKLMTKNYRDTVLRDSMSIAPVDTGKFNKHKLLFNCKNGTFDFARGIFRQFDKSDYLTEISNVVYDQTATCERFEQYLDEVMENQKDKIDYLLKIAAYCLTGDISRECFFVLYGEKTRNGKGTFVETLTHLMGTYAKTIDQASITKKSINTGGSNATPEFAKLQNARLVTVAEIADGMMLDVALIKKLTGGNTLNARQLYKEEIEYTPQFKIMIDTNFLPRMTDDTIFTSDRIHLLSFDRHFEQDERDRQLKDKLKTEVSGIFNLLVRYWTKLEDEGFIVPDSSKDVMQQYRFNSNNVLLFIKEKLFEDKLAWEPLSDVFKCYTDWCEENGYNQMAKKTFKERLARCGAKITDEVAQHMRANGTKSLSRGWVRGFAMVQRNHQQTTINEQELTPVDEDNTPF